MNKKLLFFIIIILIIIIGITILTINKKYKYFVNNSEKKENSFSYISEEQYKDIGCSTIYPLEYIYNINNGKLKATYYKSAAFKPQDRFDGYGFHDLYIAFMPEFDSEAIPRTYNSTSQNIFTWKDDYLIVKSEENVYNPYDVPSGYSVLDPL